MYPCITEEPRVSRVVKKYEEEISMSNSKMSSLNLSLLWFGAAVSIAEIMIGGVVAPLGFTKGVAAILLGHIIGTIVLFLAGYIGAQTKLASIESTTISFGKYGSYMFSILNILQLLGWTAVMVISSAKALDTITGKMFSYQNQALWCIATGALILVWILPGIKKLDKINIFATGSLFILTIVLSFTVFKGIPLASETTGTISFGAAVELSAIMPLSWLPLIADYTRFARSPKKGTVLCAVGYFVGSCWMYIIGLGAALYVGSSDIGDILMNAGLGIAAVIIVLISTVTTTFLDVYSAGISFINISKKTKEKTAAIFVCIIGVLLAIFTPIQQYENFLYLIGSVFAPLFAILITEYFIILKYTNRVSKLVNIQNLIIWALGVAIYRVFMGFDLPIGITLPVMLIISLICISVWAVSRRRRV